MILNVIFFGDKTSSLEEDEYKLHTASTGFCSILSVTRLISISNSFGCNDAQEVNSNKKE